MMRKVLLAVLVIALVGIPSFVNAQEGYRHRAVCISLVPYVSTSGSQAENTVHNFSLNLLGGYSGGLKGFELGSLLNMENGSVTGLQMTVGANYVGLDANAIQIAGAFNYSGWHTGGQLALVNISGDVVGAQVGLVNIANDVQGAQVGFFNFSNEVIGPTVGIFNFSKRGQFHIDLWIGESSLPGLGVKMGSQSFHSILSFAAQPLGDDIWWMPGVGFGGHIYYDLFFVDIDGIGYMANAVNAMSEGAEFEMLNFFKIQISAGWLFPPDFAVFAGPTVNIFTSDSYPDQTPSFYDFTLVDNDNLKIWPGFVIGVQLR
ncbi:hypothetical protein JXM67_15430 [candidate division WOR-3 bacterium]|nr:hypothetical protein [candidate division WOR-3 bacterium]